jgi:hypothetical protein|tara:strand:- start:523 stop:846 length:324 start_codon:yes stop_codon:yes gene_type:complete
MILKVNKVTTSANDANVFSYVPFSTIGLWETTATTVIIYHSGKDSDAQDDDTITVTVANIAQAKAVADRLAAIMNPKSNFSSKSVFTLDKDFANGGITTITQSTTVA